MKKRTITMTTKGTFTMPAHLRRELGINNKGDKLLYSYDAAAKRVTFSKPTTDFAASNQEVAKYTRGKKPLTDVSTFYAKRKPRTA